MRRSRGFTMVELAVAAGISAICLTVAVTAYAFAMRQTARVASQAAVAVASCEAIERMRPTITGSYQCSTYAVANGTTGLLCVVPDTSYGTDYAPYRVDTAGAARYRSGTSYLYYLSDTTGSMSSTGSCLWRATKPSGGSVFAIDISWSRYYSTGSPRISGVASLSFAVDTTNHKVTMTMGLSQSYAGSSLSASNTAGTWSTTVVRHFWYRNWN